ncbi:MAG TPA: MATE family efflux transporter [Bryobacteraceae bacterium]|nr:MATE family efflux transporter [Bryobacteraceae bacterium]
MLRLAAPLAVTELGWTVMGIVDTIMAGRLSAAAVGAGSLGNMLFYPIAIAGTGMLLGMDTLVAQAFGAGEARDCRRSLVNGMWLAAALSPIVCVILMLLVPAIRAAGVNQEVFEEFKPYLTALLWGIPPLLFTAAFRRYLQAVDVVKPMLYAMIAANLLNIAGNWVLMFGHLGVPAMGLTGSGWSTSISRYVMAAIGAAAIVLHERKSDGVLWRVSWAPDFARIGSLIRLGLPAGLQMLFEGSVFGLVTVWAARLSEGALAAHSIAVQVIATNFMVPLGISSAAAVRVGQAIGRGDKVGASSAGWTALGISAAFMGTAATVMIVAPHLIVRLFIDDPAVISAGAPLLRIAALFELFDGFQIVATGALRGIGDTRSAMIAHALGYWAVGVPAGYVLCFSRQYGAPGIWIGLTAALILIGLALVAVWWRKIRTVRAVAAVY